MRWLVDVEKYVWEMKVKKWRQKAVDKEEWASIIKEGRAIRGLEARGVRKRYTACIEMFKLLRL